MSKLQICLDMDGVIVDFVGGINESHGVTECVYKDAKNWGNWEIEEIFGLDAKGFWAPTDAEGWWRGLGKTPEADELVERCCDWVGEENVCMLTAPNKSPFCAKEKMEWVNENYPSFEKRVLVGACKGFCAAAHRVLIDDRDRNISDFKKAGGDTILWPQKWNALHRKTDRRLEWFEQKKREINFWHNT